jgi:curved DNA-binding protein CbpA
MTDLYRILGVSPKANSSEIKSAYRRLARRCHPDVSASPDANADFARINEAYHILTDPARRAAYDRGIASG